MPSSGNDVSVHMVAARNNVMAHSSYGQYHIMDGRAVGATLRMDIAFYIEVLL